MAALHHWRCCKATMSSAALRQWGAQSGAHRKLSAVGKKTTSADLLKMKYFKSTTQNTIFLRKLHLNIMLLWKKISLWELHFLLERHCSERSLISSNNLSTVAFMRCYYWLWQIRKCPLLPLFFFYLQCPFSTSIAMAPNRWLDKQIIWPHPSSYFSANYFVLPAPKHISCKHISGNTFHCG